MYITLSQNFRIRNDKHCSFLVRKENIDIPRTDDSSIIQLPPFMGYILSEFGKECYDKDIERISKYTGIKASSIRNFTDQLINNKVHKQFSIGDKYAVTFPENLLVKSDKFIAPKHYTESDFVWDDEFQIKRPSMPLTVNLMVTTGCTTNCKYCYAKRDLQPLLTTNEILNLIEELSENGVVNIMLTGGDIFTIKDWDKILNKALECECMPFLSTKTPLNTDDVDKLSKIGIHKIQFSLDSNNTNTLKYLVEAPDNYLSSVSAMFKSCSEKGISVCVRSVLTSKNGHINQVEDLYSFISKYDCVNEWALTPAFFSEHKKTEYANLEIDNSDLIEVYKFTQRDDLKFPVRLNKISKDGYKLHKHCTTSEFVKLNQICLGNTTSLSILANGLCSVCEMLYDHSEFILGDIRKSSVKEIWNSEKALSLYSPIQSECPLSSPCRDCTDFEACKMRYGKRVCYVDIVKSGGDKYTPDPRCPKSKKIDIIL